ncbi:MULTISPECIES: A24 family peptidase [Rhizobium]|uniref:Prepilin peptidase n=1 Tax=Rhizobium rhododendri TaxID=2506430 RepID=A0ABY8II34_9HYPH|nr:MULTISPECIES: prepilin peptidase [Rhizobium]MBZ5762857.1 prepilin peptidase [Rhizobium sp. VS19-DR96]MBZ5767579.1 prepilin peptidase [Rhizobium sp. VS19-DR129.2]MBZ5776247.1 prepilin peptidase [Rhizobium sp. VS19-DRK62.2]MBZ5786062.1 prepilin peptidase [Rhizobium sp. VS19-DR121]MBZ5803675.1 prepilin peptidase [Rhizobium sp. VS19-DR181]
MIGAAIFLIFPLCMAVAAFSDLFTMTIPNRVSVILVGAFLLVAPFTGLPLAVIGMHFLGALIVFALCFGFFALNIMGGGDAKLLSAAALWFGFDQSLLEFAVYVSVVGGIMTVLIFAMRARADILSVIGMSIPQSLTHAKKIPYGIAIGIGGFIAFPSSPLFLAALNQS